MLTEWTYASNTEYPITWKTLGAATVSPVPEPTHALIINDTITGCACSHGKDHDLQFVDYLDLIK